MTNQQKQQEIGQRIQAAREKARFSRSALAAEVGITSKMLEKYERGETDITIARLKAITEFLEIELGDIMPSSKAKAAGNETNLVKTAQLALTNIDNARNVGLSTDWRKTPGLIEDAKKALERLSLEDLASIAKLRNLHDFSISEWLEKTQTLNIEDARKETSALEARIIDTAILGIDLYSVQKSILEGIAEELDIEGDEWLGMDWSTKVALINELRPVLVLKVLNGYNHNLYIKE